MYFYGWSFMIPFLSFNFCQFYRVWDGLWGLWFSRELVHMHILKCFQALSTTLMLWKTSLQISDEIHFRLSRVHQDFVGWTKDTCQFEPYKLSYCLFMTSCVPFSFCQVTTQISHMFQTRALLRSFAATWLWEAHHAGKIQVTSHTSLFQFYLFLFTVNVTWW